MALSARNGRGDVDYEGDWMQASSPQPNQAEEVGDVAMMLLMCMFVSMMMRWSKMT